MKPVEGHRLKTQGKSTHELESPERIKDLEVDMFVSARDSGRQRKPVPPLLSADTLLVARRFSGVDKTQRKGRQCFCLRTIRLWLRISL